MGENVVWLITCWGCAAVFLGIAIYASKKDKPMHFWSGSTVDPETISDIPAYNKANARMWLLYSVPYWASGLIYFFNQPIAIAILVFDCTVGIAWLIWQYYRIKKRYEK